MNCIHHPNQVAFANCSLCQRPFCQNCLTQLVGGYVCSECRARKESSQAPPGAVPTRCSPGTAFGLGLIPGVGAICNGEYVKAFVHVMIFGVLVSVLSNSDLGSFEPLFGMLTSAFYFYMPLEAYHTAKRREFESKGIVVTNLERNSKHENLWIGIILIFMGCLLFLDNLIHGFMEQALRFWPIALIGFGSAKILGHFRKERVEEARR